MAGLDAQAQGRRLGIFRAARREIGNGQATERREAVSIDLLGRSVPSITTCEGFRAIKGSPIRPDSVERYLKGTFGDARGDFDHIRTLATKNQ